MTSEGLYCPTVHFTLSVPTEGMQATLVNVGRVHGCDVDKFQTIAGLTKGSPGWGEDCPLGALTTSLHPSRVFAIHECAAHMVVTVTQPPERHGGHLRIFASITQAFVLKSYWDGKNFGPRHASSPPLLSFNGTKCFSKIISL